MLTLGTDLAARFGLNPKQETAPAPMVKLAHGTCTDLLRSLRSILNRGTAIFDWVDSEREAARKLGIETIVIELLALVEGMRLRHMHDALQDAAESNSGCELTEEGIAALHRAERLIAEAERRLPGGIVPATGSKEPEKALSGASAGQAAPATPQETNPGSSKWITIAFVSIGLLAAGAMGFAIFLMSELKKSPKRIAPSEELEHLMSGFKKTYRTRLKPRIRPVPV